MSRSCQRATFSRPTSELRPDDAREPADPLGDDGIPLVRHRRRALLAAAERLLHLADLGAREVPDLEGEGVERRRDDGERREELRMAVALEDLRRRSARARGRSARTRAARARDPSRRRCRPRPRACRRASPRAPARRARVPRASSNAQPASLSPKVVGSAWTPCVRPICSVSRCSSARAVTTAKARSRPARISAPASRICSESAVSTTSEEVRP